MKNTTYVVKQIDELGGVICENEVNGYRGRQKAIREWINNEKYYRNDIEDITILIKDCGKELWVYELTELD